MHDLVDAILPTGRADEIGIIDAADDEGDIDHGTLVAQFERVDDDHFVALRPKSPNRVGSDVPGTAGNENGHSALSVREEMEVRLGAFESEIVDTAVPRRLKSGITAQHARMSGVEVRRRQGVACVEFDHSVEELVLQVLRSGQIARGPMVEAFESAVAEIAGFDTSSQSITAPRRWSQPSTSPGLVRGR